MSYIAKNMTDSLKDHELKLLEKSEHFECYRMGRPDTGVYAVYITFMNHNAKQGTAPRGQMIVITGDISLCEHTNAVASNYGYGKSWFSGQLDDSYLCEKFLRKCWSKEAAVRDLRWEAKDLRENKESDAMDIQFAKNLDEIAQELECGDSLDQGDVYEKYTDLRGSDDYSVGHDYPLAEAGWLVAVQQKFRELLPTVS